MQVFVRQRENRFDVLPVARPKTELKHVALLNEFRDLMSQLVAQVEASSAMGHFDLHRVSEGLVLGVMRELYGWQQLRNLNADERVNFPGIDLADDKASVAVQVTGTPSLEKVKGTIETFLSHKLDERYQRLVVYVLTRKQASYSQEAIDRVACGRMRFSGADDVVDMRDICAAAANVEPRRLVAALDVVRAYMRGGVAAGLSEADLDPPATPLEHATLNLVEVYFPQQIYVADLREDVVNLNGRRGRNERKRIRTALEAWNLRVPSSYEVSAGQLITFHPLDDAQGPFARLIELGTVTPLSPAEYYGNDEDYERIFKSLLRFTLQQKLHKHRVRWMHEDGLFVFLPLEDKDLLREETWTGHKKASRRVYERKLNKNDPDKTFICKHFAFATDFVLSEGRWYVSLTPDWYFSYGDDYRKSRYADDALKWLKRKEVNRTVTDHFRFLSAWLAELDEDDLFDLAAGAAPTLTFGEKVSFDNHPGLPDESWLPLRDPVDDDEDSPIKGLFDAP